MAEWWRPLALRCAPDGERRAAARGEAEDDEDEWRFDVAPHMRVR